MYDEKKITILELNLLTLEMMLDSMVKFAGVSYTKSDEVHSKLNPYDRVVYDGKREEDLGYECSEAIYNIDCTSLGITEPITVKVLDVIRFNHYHANPVQVIYMNTETDKLKETQESFCGEMLETVTIGYRSTNQPLGDLIAMYITLSC